MPFEPSTSAERVDTVMADHQPQMTFFLKRPDADGDTMYQVKSLCKLGP